MKEHSNHDQQAFSKNTRKDWIRCIWKIIKLVIRLVDLIDRLNQFFSGGND